MRKGLGIMMLCLASLLLVYSSVISLLFFKKQRVNVTYYEPDSFLIETDDEAIELQVVLEKNMLNSIGIFDKVAERKFGFNFADKKISAYFYKDKLYDIRTNFKYQSDPLIERQEITGKSRTIYQLNNDGRYTVEDF